MGSKKRAQRKARAAARARGEVVERGSACARGGRAGAHGGADKGREEERGEGTVGIAEILSIAKGELGLSSEDVSAVLEHLATAESLARKELVSGAAREPSPPPPPPPALPETFLGDL